MSRTLGLRPEGLQPRVHASGKNRHSHLGLIMRATDMLTLTASSYQVQALLVVLRMTCRLENNYY